jgi:hypothetical protein
MIEKLKNKRLPIKISEETLQESLKYPTVLQSIVYSPSDNPNMNHSVRILNQNSGSISPDDI